MFCLAPFLLLLWLYHPVSAFVWRSGDSCPDTIHAVVSYGTRFIFDDAADDDVRGLPSVYAALTNCQNVSSLQLKIEQGGCAMSSDDQWNFNFRPDDKFTALKTLRIAGYDWDNRWEWSREWQAAGYPKGNWYWRNSWVDIFLFRDLPSVQVFFPDPTVPEPQLEKGSNLEGWVRAMDWDHLEVLEIDDPAVSFLETMAPKLRNLQDLSIRGWTNTTAHFLGNLPPLVNVSVVGVDNHLDYDVVLGHCSYLQKFTFRKSRPYGCSTGRTRIDPGRLKVLSDSCLSLRELEIDLFWNTSWTQGAWKTLANMKSLEKLELWLDPAPSSGTSELDINGTVAQELFTVLRARKAGRELVELTLHFNPKDVDHDYYFGGSAVTTWTSFLCSSNTVDGVACGTAPEPGDRWWDDGWEADDKGKEGEEDEENEQDQMAQDAIIGAE